MAHGTEEKVQSLSLVRPESSPHRVRIERAGVDRHRSNIHSREGPPAGVRARSEVSGEIAA